MPPPAPRRRRRGRRGDGIVSARRPRRGVSSTRGTWHVAAAVLRRRVTRRDRHGRGSLMTPLRGGARGQAAHLDKFRNSRRRRPLPARSAAKSGFVQSAASRPVMRSMEPAAIRPPARSACLAGRAVNRTFYDGKNSRQVPRITGRAARRSKFHRPRGACL